METTIFIVEIASGCGGKHFTLLAVRLRRLN
jgi:hypothetical protein